jgi:hypothetical protein
MSVPLDDTEFVDRDALAAQAARPAGPLPPLAPMNAPQPPSGGRPPTRAELESQLTSRQQQLAELKARQEAIERERVALEEARRRQAEFETGRPEMIQHLTRGIELLTRAEFAARREAEQMAKSLAGLREALEAVQALKPESWTPETWQTELTRALTVLENARMEWNSARLKWPVLNGETAATAGSGQAAAPPSLAEALAGRSLGELCKLGLALTWPLAVVALLAVIVLAFALFRS